MNGKLMQQREDGRPISDQVKQRRLSGDSGRSLLEIMREVSKEARLEILKAAEKESSKRFV